MLPETPLKARLAAGDTVFGSFLTLGSPLAAEALGPAGSRGVALFPRGARFGTDPEAMRHAAERTLGIAQIESPEAVEAVEGIAAGDGIDVVFVGPSDLSHSMGIPRQFDDPRFRQAIERVVAAAEGARKAAGIFVASVDDAGRALDDGFRMIAVGSDGGWMLQAARQAVTQLRALSRRSAPAAG